jgi:2-methoxy-6-polyprenyl-1,4-benzoquinol methylase
MVAEVFSKVASKYDIMNDFMSLGAHRLWKDELIRSIGFPAARKADPARIPRHLDVAGGTGDVAFRSMNQMIKEYGSLERSNESDSGVIEGIPFDHNRQIVVCDINPEMLAVGRTRVHQQVGESNADFIGFVEGNAEHLPFPDDSFDIYTIAFGLRNVTNKDVALKEAYRVLRKGGRIIILEFSHVENPILRPLYDQYSFYVIPKIGEIVANDKDSYQYLVESIRNFPKQEALRRMVGEAGFEFCSYTNMTLGVVAMHSGFKLR